MAGDARQRLMALSSDQCRPLVRVKRIKLNPVTFSIYILQVGLLYSVTTFLQNGLVGLA